MRKLEDFTFKFLFPAVLVNFIVLDFLHEHEWVTFGLQFGPLIAVIVFILLMAALEKRPSDEVEETKEDKREGRNRYLFIIVLIVSLNLFWGEPNADILNIARFEFWVGLIILPALSRYDYKKKTDNIRG